MDSSTFIQIGYVAFGIWFFYCGCAIGSFLDVLVDRLPNDRNILNARSECTSCHTILKWYDLFPLFSYFLLKGKCRYCGEKLSPMYLVSEVSTGILFVMAYYKYIHSFNIRITIMYLALWCMLYVVAAIDQKYYIIIDQVLLVGVIIGFVSRLTNSRTLFGDWYITDTILECVVGVAVGLLFYGIIYWLAKLIFKREGFGSGDVLLLGAMGVFFSPQNVFVIGVLAFYMSAILIAVHVFRFKDKWRENPMPFGPAICLAAFAMSVFQTQILEGLTYILGIDMSKDMIMNLVEGLIANFV